MNALRLLHISAILLLCSFPSRMKAGEWLSGERAIYVIKTVEPKGAALHGPEIRVTDERMTHPIYVVGSVRRERATSGTVNASVSDLRPGVRIRAYGDHSSSPFGFIADRILILKK